MRPAFRTLWIVALVVSFPAFARPAHAQVAPCDASPKVSQALRDLPEDRGDALAAHAAMMGALNALLNRYPDDVFVHSRYQDEATRGRWLPRPRDRDAVIQQYRALAAKHPNDPAYTYLAARVQIGVHTKDVMPQLEAVASRVPPARLALVRIYQTPNFGDPKKARSQLESFMSACPGALAAYPYVQSAEPPEALPKFAEMLRGLLASRADPEAVTSFSTLWKLEFRVKSPAEHDAVRQQIRSDLKRLRAMETGAKTGYFSVMRDGYELTNDSQGMKWAGEQIRLRSPSGYLAYQAVTDDWNKANPYPKQTDSPEKRQAYFDAYLKVFPEWARDLPDNNMFWFDHVTTLRQADRASAADVEAAGERLLRIVAKNQTVLGPNYPLVVANLYATKGVRLDRLPTLVKDGLAEMDAPSTSLPSDLYARPAAEEQESAEYERWDAWTTIADIWIKAKDKDRARDALGHVRDLADGSKPKDPKQPKYAEKQRAYLSRQVTYWGSMGDLAKLEGRKLDAITFYQNALLARLESPSAGRKDDLAEKARGLWTEAGGTNEAWQAWSTRRDLFGQNLTDPAAEGRWTKIEKPLPEFELADLSGGKWRLADFKGKTTLVGIWATW